MSCCTTILGLENYKYCYKVLHRNIKLVPSTTPHHRLGKKAVRTTERISMENTIHKERAYSELNVRPISFLLFPAQELALLVRSTTICPAKHTVSSREALEAAVLSPASLEASGKTCCL